MVRYLNIPSNLRMYVTARQTDILEGNLALDASMVIPSIVTLKEKLNTDMGDGME